MGRCLRDFPKSALWCVICEVIRTKWFYLQNLKEKTYISFLASSCCVCTLLSCIELGLTFFNGTSLSMNQDPRHLLPSPVRACKMWAGSASRKLPSCCRTLDCRLSLCATTPWLSPSWTETPLTLQWPCPGRWPNTRVLIVSESGLPGKSPSRSQWPPGHFII